MEVLLILVPIIIAFVIYIVVSTKINNFKYRAKQSILGSFGIGSSNINAGLNGMQEKHALENLLAAHPNLTEQVIKDTIYAYSLDLINGRPNAAFDQKVNEKMVGDNTLITMRATTFTRVNVLGYRNGTFSAIAVYSTSSDEYQITMTINIMDVGGFYLTHYDAMKGMVKGL